ncbi:MAG: 4Fe-4S binding protein [Candidatus Hadarchaeum sp.]
MMLKDRVRRLALKLGADLVGFGPAEAMDEAPAGHRARDFLPSAKTVFSTAARINYSAVDGLPLTRREYINANDSSRALLNGVICGISRYLEEEGYSAIPFLQGTDRKVLMGDLSLKHAAVVAGLGEFGLNNLLLTPRFGPRVLLGAVVTDALIVPDPPLREQLCDLCGACLKACPVGAIKELKDFDRKKGGAMDKYKCSHYINEILEPEYGHHSCGLCIKACHVGKVEKVQKSIQAKLK